jgi:hypothetical protein
MGIKKTQKMSVQIVEIAAQASSLRICPGLEIISRRGRRLPSKLPDKRPLSF